MHKDARGHAVTLTRPAALDAYERALHAFHTYRGDPFEPLNQALWSASWSTTRATSSRCRRRTSWISSAAIRSTCATASRACCRRGAPRPPAMSTSSACTPSASAIAYCDGRYDDAAEKLLAVRDDAARFGGSHAQRDRLTLTLIDSAKRAGRNRLARHYANERLVHKPASAWGKRLAGGLTPAAAASGQRGTPALTQ